jgi:hypothetical protein
MRWLAIVCVLGACVDTGPGPQPKKLDPKVIAAGITTSVPPHLVHVEVGVGGFVNYVGNAGPISVIPGQAVRITHVWQVILPPGPGWRVFALLRGEPGTADFMNLEATDMELGHPVATWKTGEVISDVQDFTLRPDWRSPTATLYVGLIRTGGHDVGDRMPATGSNTLDRAVVATKFQVDLSKAPPPPGTVYVPHTTGAITVDGIGFDPGWGLAAMSPDFATAEGSQDPVGKANAKLAWDENYLYAYVVIQDTDIVSPYKNHDDKLWMADAVELFIDADGNRHGYVELQVNPNGATFDSWFATTRAQPGDETWDSNMQTAVKLHGTTEPGDTDQGWEVEIAVPWAAVKGRDETMQINIPPHVGDRWRLNVVRTNQRTGGKSQAEGGASSWNRISVQDFHALDRMLTVVFADATGAIVAK